MAFKGYARFPGVSAVISCTYTCGHGTEPGAATLVVPFQRNLRLPEAGVLEFGDGVNRPIRLTNCRVERVDNVELADGPGLALTLLDRRWMWRFGRVDGFFNQTDTDPDPSTVPVGNVVTPPKGPFIPGTERTAAQLLRYCLDAMGEAGYELRGVPPDARPATDWQAANPARAAAAVCDEIGCRLVFQPAGNRVLVAPVGGPFVLNTGNLAVLDDRPGQDLPPGPTHVQVVCGPNLVADVIKLEAVGYEEDGRVRPIHQLSYMPPGGWWTYIPGLNHWADCPAGDSSSADVSKALAKTFVWRLFRVAGVATDGGSAARRFPPIATFPPIKNRKAITLLDRVYNPVKDASGQYQSFPAYYWTNGYDRTGDRRGNPQNYRNFKQLSGGFTIDSARGLVTFEKHQYRIREKNGALGDLYVTDKRIYGEPDPNRLQLIQAGIYLYTTCKVRDPNTWHYFRAEYELALGVGGAKRVEVVHRPDLQLVTRVFRDQDAYFDLVYARTQRVRDNSPDVRARALLAARLQAARHQRVASRVRTVAGIHHFDPDGAVRQVTWSIGDGGSPPSTTVGVNTEYAVWERQYADVRRNERALGFVTDEWVKQTLRKDSEVL